MPTASVQDSNMPARLVALDEGPDIPLDRTMVVVGRHPQCDARLDSLRVSRHHCCMTHDHGEVVVRDLGSTNGIRINGQRVEMGRLRPGDELSIAHIRFRLDDGLGHELTLADNNSLGKDPLEQHGEVFSPLVSPMPCESPSANVESPYLGSSPDENPLAKAVRGLLPAGMAERCRIQVIVQMRDEKSRNEADAAENLDACRPNSPP